MERGKVESAAAQQHEKDEKEAQSLVFCRTMLMAAVGREADMRAEIERLRAELLRLQIMLQGRPTNPLYPRPSEWPWYSPFRPAWYDSH